MPRPYSETLRQKADKTWRAIDVHPFLSELHAGSLSTERFTHFIKQDYLYLLDFAQVLCLGGAKSPDLKTLETFNRHSLMAVQVERDFHTTFGRQLGISPEELDRTPKAHITEAYTKHMQANAHTGSLGEIVATILPCYWIYGEVGKRLFKTRPKQPRIYREWIELYASDEYWRGVEEQLALMDALGAAANRDERSRMAEHFLLSSRYELLFWEQAYRLESWKV